MRKLVLAIATSIVGLTLLKAQELSTIKLNSPDKSRGTAVMKALSDRHSSREFSDRELSLQDLSDLLWAANGINRENGKRTAASALNKQDVDVYVFTKNGAYLYEAKLHELKPVAAGDYRKLIAMQQTFVENAPISLVLVSDLARFGTAGTVEQRKQWGAFDAGLVSQNVALFCSGCGLATVPRATMDVEKIRDILKLSDTQIPIINNPVGYPKQ